ncbi:unnamed protein product [Symbiodinium necroappetens]|uniref:PDZ domain-containing protein n=1 Tax=Symbiodinium necroappetens TaxID=1628268 RepID=A0A812Q883_9DINO|nr:unnamed protein product [Symbiodinium necroappetens]
MRTTGEWIMKVSNADSDLGVGVPSSCGVSQWETSLKSETFFAFADEKCRDSALPLKRSEHEQRPKSRLGSGSGIEKCAYRLDDKSPLAVPGASPTHRHEGDAAAGQQVPTWAQAAQAAPSASASSSSMPLGTAAIQGYHRLLRTKNESRRSGRANVPEVPLWSAGQAPQSGNGNPNKRRIFLRYVQGDSPQIDLANLTGGQGNPVIIQVVTPGGRAEQNGVKAGAVIRSINASTTFKAFPAWQASLCWSLVVEQDIQGSGRMLQLRCTLPFWDDMSMLRGYGAVPCVPTMQGGLRLELVEIISEDSRDLRLHEKLCLRAGGLRASLNFAPLEFTPFAEIRLTRKSELKLGIAPRNGAWSHKTERPQHLEDNVLLAEEVVFKPRVLNICGSTLEAPASRRQQTGRIMVDAIDLPTGPSADPVIYELRRQTMLRGSLEALIPARAAFSGKNRVNNHKEQFPFQGPVAR